MILNKSISKIKVNSVIGEEIDLIIQIAVNVCRGFYQSEDSSQFSDLAHEEFDKRVEHLVSILVNISDHPHEYSRYFNQTLVFELETKGFSVIKYFVDVIKDIDEGVLTNLIDLSFKEDLDKYQIFSILFKLVKQSESTDVLEYDSEISSHRSSDSNAPGSFLASLSSKKNIITRAVLLGVYKSFSSVNDIQVLGKLFFIMFIPYFFPDYESKNLVLKLIDNIQDSNDDIEYILVSIIQDPQLSPTPLDLLDKAVEIEAQRSRIGSDISHRAKFESLEERKGFSGNTKNFTTFLIEELNSLIRCNFLPIKRMIQLSIKIAVCSIPQDLSVDGIRSEYDESETTVTTAKSVLHQISKSQNLEKISQGLIGIQPNSIFGFTLDFDCYDYLHEMLVLSVKISFAGDEIDENKECNRVINEIWSMMCHKHTLFKIYSFLLFVKYKLQNKILDNKLLADDSHSIRSKYSTELFSRTDQIINLIFEKIGEHFHEDS